MLLLLNLETLKKLLVLELKKTIKGTFKRALELGPGYFRKPRSNIFIRNSSLKKHRYYWYTGVSKFACHYECW